jgi:hypothetical protein
MKRLLPLAGVLALALPLTALAQSEEAPRTSGPGLSLTVNGWGLALGNVPRVNGVRINWRDHYLEEVNGLNITLWHPIDLPKDAPGGTVNGVSLGLFAPAADRLNGINIGGVAVLARDRLWGVNLGGVGAVSEGTLTGLNFGTLAVVGEHSVTGISLGGLAVVGQGPIAGLNLSGMAVVSEDGVTGVSVGALGAVVSQGPIRGFQFGGLAVVSEDGMWGFQAGGLAAVTAGGLTGINLAGLAVVAEDRITGLSIGGLAVVSQGPIRWLQAGGLAVVSEESVAGLTLAGYRIQTPKLNGAAFALVTMTPTDLTGIGIGGYNDVRGVQKGITIGLLNRARELHGVQIGLFNCAENNPPFFRYLPVLNLHLKN